MKKYMALFFWFVVSVPVVAEDASCVSISEALYANSLVSATTLVSVVGEINSEEDVRESIYELLALELQDMRVVGQKLDVDWVRDACGAYGRLMGFKSSRGYTYSGSSLNRELFELRKFCAD